jgi:two-component system response regulator (stage 0 sporulation protein F)
VSETATDRSILVVDDQLGVRRLLFEAFKEDGYNVRLAASGFEAISQVNSDPPKLILMDMKMPGMKRSGSLARD